MNARVFLCTTLLLLFHPQFHGQAVTNELPSAPEPRPTQTQPLAPTSAATALQDAVRGGSDIPEATLIDQPPTGEVVRMEADHQSKDKNIVKLTGNVVVHYTDYVIRSQELVYDEDTGIVTSAGVLKLDGGPDDEHITAAHGEMNLKEQSGYFYDAVGTISPPPPKGRTLVLQSVSPFLFTGKEVVKRGPARYTIIKGVVTSCELPHPDWAFRSSRIEVDDQTSRLYHSIFTLVDVPVFYFPYATHSLDAADGRQSGFLIPEIGTSSTKGLILGDEYYWVINRSMDAWLGLEYFSLRGWSQLGQFRYKGRDLDFAQFHFTALQDRGQPGTGVDQGGEDLVFRGRHDFTENTRVAANIEYLSSYTYREAFAESFAQAVTSEVKSTAYITHAQHGYEETGEIDRYQNFESTSPGDEVKILHLPALEGTAMDHAFGHQGWLEDHDLSWGGSIGVAGLKRSEPGFSSTGPIERIDFYPHLSWTAHLDGWTFRPAVALRDTFYTRSQVPGVAQMGLGDVVPREVDVTLNRKDGEASVEIRAPAVERDFETSNGWQWRHVIEPEAQYRFVGGINNFMNVLRFDDVDIVSDTNEIEYGVTQRLYVKHRRMQVCKPGEMPAKGQTLCAVHAREAVSWFVGQKYFLDPNFGGAITPGVRNVLQTTIDFSGIAYLTAPRDISPVVSRLRWRSTEKLDVEWDVDYDTKRGELLASNSFIDYRQGFWTAGAGFSHLIEPDEVFVVPLGESHSQTFNQIRWTLGYGSPTKRGFSVATTGGYDFDTNAVQYAVVQTGYNWNCCGFSAEYRRFALGSVRNENQYRFNLTLAGVGTAGNLKKAERLF